MKRSPHLRPERAEDQDAIGRVTAAAFTGSPDEPCVERRIIDVLRTSGALTLSLVALLDDVVVGHVAFSPVTLSDGSPDWYGLGPVSVSPAHQNAGVGSALIRDGLDRLRGRDARGCVVLGEPEYYGRFGFVVHPGLRYAGAPAEYFQRLVFTGVSPTATVTYARAFDIA